jgi:hypothetical protein
MIVFIDFFGGNRMSKTLKWILGIVIGLIVVAVVLAGVGLVVSRWHGGYAMMGGPELRGWDGRRGWSDDQMPMMRDRSFPMGAARPFAPLWTLGIGLLCLGGLALIVLGIIALVQVIRRPTPQPAAVAPAGEPATAATHPCPSCERPVQDDWAHCPYCGTDLAG